MNLKSINDLVLVLIFTFINAIFGFKSNLSKGHAEVGVYSFMNMDTCGYMSPKDVPKTKIVDGEQAKEGEFPWMASIHYMNKSNIDTFTCGGVLVTFEFVLTAGHCVYRKDNTLLRVYLGSVNKYGFESIHNVSIYYLVPKGDLAIVKLKTPAKPILKADHYIINTICLPTNRILNNEKEEAVVSGFGPIDSQNLKPSNHLLKAVLIINSYTDCLAMYHDLTLYEICVTESQHMTCYGDSGSGLVQFDGNRAVLIGTVIGGKTFTKNICGPGVLLFSRISFFIDYLAYFFYDITLKHNETIVVDQNIKSSIERNVSFVNKLNMQTILILSLILSLIP